MNAFWGLGSTGVTPGSTVQDGDSTFTAEGTICPAVGDSPGPCAWDQSLLEQSMANTGFANDLEGYIAEQQGKWTNGAYPGGPTYCPSLQSQWLACINDLMGGSAAPLANEPAYVPVVSTTLPISYGTQATQAQILAATTPAPDPAPIATPSVAPAPLTVSGGTYVDELAAALGWNTVPSGANLSTSPTVPSGGSTVQYPTPIPTTPPSSSQVVTSTPGASASAPSSSQVVTSTAGANVGTPLSTVPAVSCFNPLSSAIGADSCLGPMGIVEWAILAGLAWWALALKGGR